MMLNLEEKEYFCPDPDTCEGVTNGTLDLPSVMDQGWRGRPRKPSRVARGLPGLESPLDHDSLSAALWTTRVTPQQWQ